MINIPKQINFLKLAGIDAPRKGPDKKYPSFNLRMIAATIDSFLAMFTIGPLLDSFLRRKPFDLQALQEKLRLAGSEQESVQVLLRAIHDSGIVENTLLQGIALLLISGVCWHYWAATPGKMLLRMRVVDAVSEQPVGMRQIILRLAGYIVSALTLGLGFFWISFDRRCQGLHDKIAGTTVIFIPKTPAAHPTNPPAPSESA